MEYAASLTTVKVNMASSTGRPRGGRVAAAVRANKARVVTKRRLPRQSNTRPPAISVEPTPSKRSYAALPGSSTPASDTGPMISRS